MESLVVKYHHICCYVALIRELLSYVSTGLLSAYPSEEYRISSVFVLVLVFVGSFHCVSNWRRSVLEWSFYQVYFCRLLVLFGRLSLLWLLSL